LATTVLLIGLPPLLEDMVSSVLADHFNIQKDRDARNGARIIEAAIEAGAPVVVVASRNPSDLSSIDPYLAKAATVSVVALALDGTSACVHAFNPGGLPMEDVSAEQIVTAIAAASGQRL
jgi:hypothetical protein